MGPADRRGHVGEGGVRRRTRGCRSGTVAEKSLAQLVNLGVLLAGDDTFARRKFFARIEA